jgi:two-component system alkaline phosphatase synthesis response regulator PhoP
MQKILIVEDDESIREIVIYALRSAGYDAAGFESGDGLFAALDQGVSLILLDVMLPGQDGLGILKTLRASAKTKALPVIMLTAKGSELDKVKGLDFGADDYITKPFGVMELISRVGAVLRRSGGKQEENERLTSAGILLDKARRVVTVGGEAVNLTYKEYELLYYLMLNRGLALSREQIMREVWGFDFEGESRTLDMHIRTLRRKLGAEGERIQTVRNVGYKLTEEHTKL